MESVEIHVGRSVRQRHEVEIDGATVAAFWRLGRVLDADAPRDRDVFALGRCIGNTSATTAKLEAFGALDDPASFAMSKLIYGGDEPMMNAYWQPADDPVVFQLARLVHRRCADRQSERLASDSAAGGMVIFDVSGDAARLCGIRFELPE
ncbi:MAG: hypothetical protein V3T70_01465 [Phycisphaerae bacterium]